MKPSTTFDHISGKAGEFDKLFLLWGTVGFLAGAGMGFAYVCPIAALIKWFPEHKGLVSGVAVAGFGFGAYLFKGRSIGALGYIQEHGIAQFFLVLQAGMMFVLAGMNTELSLAVGASIVGFNFGGNFALFPSATADLFGAKNLGANYGWVFTAYGIAGVVGIAAGNAAKTMTGSYAAAFILAGCLCLLSAGLAIGLNTLWKQTEAVRST